MHDVNDNPRRLACLARENCFLKVKKRMEIQLLAIVKWIMTHQREETQTTPATV